MVEETNCRFCKIIKGEIPDFILWKNDNFILILDKHPINEGHCMLIPKQHIDSIYDLDENLSSEIFLLARKFSPIIKEYSNAIKVGLLVKGFDIPHAHLHLIPLFNSGEDLNSNIMKKTAYKLKALIEKTLH